MEEHFNGDFELVGIEFNTNGTKLFIFDETSGSLIKQYSLNSPYNLSNPTLQKQSTGPSNRTFEDIKWTHHKDLHLALMALKCL